MRGSLFDNTLIINILQKHLYGHFEYEVNKSLFYCKNFAEIDRKRALGILAQYFRQLFL